MSVLFPVYASDRDSQDTESSIIERVVAAYGGPEAIERAAAVYARGSVTAFVRKDEGEYIRHFQRGGQGGGRLRVELRYSRTPELRVLDGPKGYRAEGDEQPTEVTGPRYLAMLYQCKYLDLPYGMMKGRYKVSHLGRLDIEGGKVDVLALSDSEGPPMRAYVSATSGLILKVYGLFDIMGQQTDLSAEFSDFREAGGTVMPFVITNFAAGGVRIGRTVIDEYKVEPGGFDPSLWEPSWKTGSD